MSPTEIRARALELAIQHTDVEAPIAQILTPAAAFEKFLLEGHKS